MTNLILLAIGSALVNNVALSQFLGLCPFLGVSKKVKTASGMGMAVIFVITIASFVAAAIYRFILTPLDLTYLRTIVFILVIAALVQFVEMFLKKFAVSLYEALGVYLPLITTNCAVLGVTILNIDSSYTFWQSIMNAFGSGLGFFLAMVLFAGVRSRLESANPPEAFKGLPITLVSAAIVSVSFFGFAGLVENLFA